MKLTPEQRAHFDREGYLFFPGLFTPAETRTLVDAVPPLYARREAYNVREKGSDAVRTNFAAHLYSEPFAKLARHPRMVEPVMELFDEAVYMHQFKINGKMAFEGDVWQWHQDYGTWLNDDMMPTERAMNVAIFLDETPPADGLRNAKNVAEERMAVGKREIYVHYPLGQGPSRLTIPAAARGTARNMNTVAKLAELAKETS